MYFLVYVRTKVYLCHNEIFLMPKGTKTLAYVTKMCLF